MFARLPNKGFTLSEVLVVVAVVALLIGIAVPSAEKVLKSFETSGNLTSVINSALTSARAIAAKEGKYAGLRFQQDLEGRQYMIFIVNDDAATSLANGFCAVTGLKPMKLPLNIGVMDLRVKDASDVSDTDIEVVGDDAAGNDNINDNYEVIDTTTFSIVIPIP